MTSKEDLISTAVIKSSHYIIGAAALAAVLSLNDAINSSIHLHFPDLKKGAVMTHYIYAFITVIVFILLIVLMPDTSSEMPPKVREHLQARGI